MSSLPNTHPTAAETYAALHLRFNFTILVAEAGLFFLGLAFFDTWTVLPLLLKKLNASDTLIGFVRLVQTLGFTLPALIAAHAIHGRKRHKSFLVWACLIARSGLFTLPFAIFFLAESHPGLLVGWLFLVFSQFYFIDGGCAVSWYDICAKAIPARVRGRFFGSMQTVGGIVAIGAAAGVSFVLSKNGPPFPLNFALLSGCWALAAFVSMLMIGVIREPEGDVHEDEKPRFMAYLKETIPLLKRNLVLRQVIIIRLFLEGAGMALPFYVLFAQKDLKVAAAMFGAYVAAKSVGKIGTGPLWGWVCDRFGPMTGLRSVAFCVALVPLATLGVWWLGEPNLMLVPFFLMGAVEDGVWMTSNNALMGSGPEKERPMVIGAYSVSLAPAAIFGPIGGLLAQNLGYVPTFVGAAAFGLAGFLIAVIWRRASV